MNICQRCQIEIKDPNVALNDAISYNDLPEKAKSEDLMRIRVILCGDCKREFLEVMDDFINKKPSKSDFKKRLDQMVARVGKGRNVDVKALGELIKPFKAVVKK